MRCNDAQTGWLWFSKKTYGIIKRFYPEATPDAPSPVRAADGPSLDGIELLIAATPQQAVAAVDALAAEGADWVKLYEQTPPDAFAAAVRRAKDLGLPTMADLGMISLAFATIVVVDQISGLARNRLTHGAPA